MLGLLGSNVEDDVLLHVQQQSAAEEAARGAAQVLDGLALADVLAISEAEARQQKAEATREQSQLRAVLKASRCDAQPSNGSDGAEDCSYGATTVTTASTVTATVTTTVVTTADVAADVAGGPVTAAAVAARAANTPSPAAPVDASFAPAGFDFTFSPPTEEGKALAGMMVPAEDAAFAIHKASEMTAILYENQIVTMQEETSLLRRENAELREAFEEQREISHELQDELQYFKDELAASKTEHENLASSPNVVALWSAQHDRAEAQREQAKLAGQLEEANLRIEQLLKQERHEHYEGRHSSKVVSQELIDAGASLGKQLSTKAGARELLADASAHSQSSVRNWTGGTMPEAGLTKRRVNQFAQHIEAVILGAGAGDLGRTQIMLAAVLDRPVIQRMLSVHGSIEVRKDVTRQNRPQKAVDAAMKMLDHARETLHHLSNRGKQGDRDRFGRSNDNRGTRHAQSQLAFETIVAALLPDDASEDQSLRIIGELLGLNWEQLHRASLHKRKAVESGGTGVAFADAVQHKRGSAAAMPATKAVRSARSGGTTTRASTRTTVRPDNS